MWANILVLLVLVGCIYLVARRVWRRLRRAADTDGSPCGGDCGRCSSSEKEPFR